MPFGFIKRVYFPFAAPCLVIALGSTLAACGLGLPGSAPTSLQLEGSVQNADFSFQLVPVNARVVSILQGYRPGSLSASFRSTGGYAASNALHPGDFIALTIYETGGSTLFPPPSATPNFAPNGGYSPNSVPAGNSTVPAQAVEADGTINVPFVGRVRVAGRTPGQVARTIEEQLKGKAVNPQVIVSLVNNASNTATVGGDVAQPRPVPLSLRGERLLDVIAAAGGAKAAAYDTYVEIVRHGVSGKVLLQTVVRNPAENIIVRPNDQIFLTRSPRSFAVLGASQKPALFAFETERVTLAEAIARAGGPVDQVGDASGIYLFRFEPLPLAQDLMREAGIPIPEGPQPEFVPVLYRLSLQQAEGYFYAQSMQMRDKDVVLISNAEATQLLKLLAVAKGFSGIASDISKTTWVR